MQALLEFIELNETIELSKMTNLLEFELASTISRHKDSAVNKFTPEQDADIGAKLEEAIKRLQAARHGLGITNRLRNPEDRKKNKSRIMKNLNLLRRIVQFVEQQLENETSNATTPNNQSMTPTSGNLNQNNTPVESTRPNGSRIDEKWDTNYETPKSKKGMWDGWSKTDLRKKYDKLKKSGPHKKGSKEFTKMKELAFALRAKKKGEKKWGKVSEGKIPPAHFLTYGDKVSFTAKDGKIYNGVVKEIVTSNVDKYLPGAKCAILVYTEKNGPWWVGQKAIDTVNGKPSPLKNGVTENNQRTLFNVLFEKAGKDQTPNDKKLVASSMRQTQRKGVNPYDSHGAQMKTFETRWKMKKGAEEATKAQAKADTETQE